MSARLNLHIDLDDDRDADEVTRRVADVVREFGGSVSASGQVDEEKPGKGKGRRKQHDEESE